MIIIYEGDNNLTNSNAVRSRTEMSSRLTQNTSNNQSGCLVNYQLSNFNFREKGWTVFNSNEEDRLIDNQRKALLCLKTSSSNM